MPLGVPLNDTGQSDNPGELPASGAQRDNQVWSSLGALFTGAWLPPDLLATWWERVLVAIIVVASTFVDIVRHGL
jgi:hypothetical protein